MKRRRYPLVVQSPLPTSVPERLVYLTIDSRERGAEAYRRLGYSVEMP